MAMAINGCNPMRAELPYHFCEAPGCTEMVQPGHLLCLRHFRATVVDDGDLFFPALESLEVPTPIHTNPKEIHHE
jgi:hypothetical protein